jgi:hypothetical protein
MPRHLHLSRLAAGCVLCLIAATTCAQRQDTATKNKVERLRLAASDVNYQSPKHTLDQQLVYGQWDVLMNPIYITQIYKEAYKLNGQPVEAVPKPQFYALVPGQNPLLGNAITDEAGNYYVSFRICAFDHSSGFFHNMRLILGATHDKLQTGSDTVYYKYTNGGTEATVMLEKNLLPELTRINYSRLRLIFNWNAQAGLLASLAKIQTHMIWQGDTIVGANNNRFQFPNPRSGWGGIIASNIEVGVPVFRWLGVTVGSRLIAEYLHSGTDVTFDGKSGYHLTHNNYALSFCGPIIGLKIIDKL